MVEIPFVSYLSLDLNECNWKINDSVYCLLVNINSDVIYVYIWVGSWKTIWVCLFCVCLFQLRNEYWCEARSRREYRYTVYVTYCFSALSGLDKCGSPVSNRRSKLELKTFHLKTKTKNHFLLETACWPSEDSHLFSLDASLPSTHYSHFFNLRRNAEMEIVTRRQRTWAVDM